MVRALSINVVPPCDPTFLIGRGFRIKRTFPREPRTGVVSRRAVSSSQFRSKSATLIQSSDGAASRWMARYFLEETLKGSRMTRWTPIARWSSEQGRTAAESMTPLITISSSYRRVNAAWPSFTAGRGCEACHAGMQARPLMTKQPRSS